MLEAMDQYFAEFVRMQDEISSSQGEENHSIYDKRLTEPDPKKYPEFRLTPHSMYFYYVRVNSDGRLAIDHYFYVTGHPDVPITWAQIPYNEQGLTALVTKLAINARPVTQDAPRVPDPPLL